MKHASDTDRSVESQMAYEILAYLTQNPDAGDTMEGIIEWWLLEQKIKRETERVRQAIDELVTRGLVLERKGRGARAYYRINSRKRKEILALLKNKTDPSEKHGIIK